MNNLAFLFYCFLLLPVGSFAQHKIPVLEQCTITQLKANSQIIIPVKKQVIPFREKIFVRFEELGEIYNPTFPETRHKISVYNFQQQGAGFLYLSKSLSTYRSSVMIYDTGLHYGVWTDGKCDSLMEYEVTRVGENLEITGKVYSCFYGS